MNITIIKKKIVKACKKILFPLKFKFFEIRGFDSTATLCCFSNIVMNAKEGLGVSFESVKK